MGVHPCGGTQTTGYLGRLRARILHGERGFALVMALGVLVVLSIIGTTVAMYSTSGLHASYSDKASTSAYHLAEAGINNALAVLYNQLDSEGAIKTPNGIDPRSPTLLASRTVQYPEMGGSVTYSGTLDSSYVWTITSTGHVKVGALDRTRTLKKTVSVIGINPGSDGGSWSRFYQDATTPCLTIDTETFVTNVATRGDLCIRNTGGVTGAATTVDVGGNVSILGATVTPAARVATAASGWTTSTNVFVNDTSYATNSPAVNSTGATLTTSGYGFSIPANATIKGIQATVIRKAAVASTIQDANVFIVKGGAQTGTNHAIAGTWTTSNVTQSYGTTSDLWGTTWTPAEINASNFGLNFAAKAGGTSTSAQITYISITVTYIDGAPAIGTSSVPVAAANIGGTCTYNNGTAHVPCSPADHVWANSIATVAEADNTALDMPQVDFTYWWKNAKPGPKHFCTNANPGISTTFFDNDSGSTNAPNKSITINGEMAPATTDYDCQYWENGQMVGQMKWNHTTHRFDIKGTIFVDGNFRFDEDGQIIHYFGRGTLMSSRDDEIDALVCAGGTGNTYATSCLPNMSSWDMTNMMVLMSQMPNEYDQGSTTCTGGAYNCYNGHVPAGFQGILYSTSDCLIHQSFQDSGPVICNTITLPNESGNNPTFYAFPYIGNLTDGQKFSDTATATNFMLTNGSQSGG
jgi:hypothetical protein